MSAPCDGRGDIHPRLQKLLGGAWQNKADDEIGKEIRKAFPPSYSLVTTISSSVLLLRHLSSLIHHLFWLMGITAGKKKECRRQLLLKGLIAKRMAFVPTPIPRRVKEEAISQRFLTDELLLASSSSIQVVIS